MNFLNHKIPPPVLLLLTALAMWFGVGHEAALQSVRELASWRWTAVAVLVVLSGVFGLGGTWAFRRAKTTVNPLRPEWATSLVDSGVYRITRNPMYVGFVMHLAALAIMLPLGWQSAMPLVYALYLTRFQIIPEEQVLLTLFGDEYRAYRARVRRWV